MNNILLIGASEHAKVVMDVIEKEGKHNIFGLIDSYKPAGGNVFGYKILGTEETLVELIKGGEVVGGIITIEYKFGIINNDRINKIIFFFILHPLSLGVY